MVDDGTIAMVLEKAKEAGVLVTVHAENPTIIDNRTARLIAEGKTSAWYHYESRPEFVEAEAIRRVVYLAKTFKAPLYIVHLACRDGLEEITKARDEGFEIYAETCPHYLNFT
jgi:dihydropyrimidinase